LPGLFLAYTVAILSPITITIDFSKYKQRILLLRNILDELLREIEAEETPKASCQRKNLKAERKAQFTLPKNWKQG
jgi:hypothetical protein